MRESSFSNTIKGGLKRLTIPVKYRRIEDAASKGTPDAYIRCTLGCAWVELKYLEAWPKRPSTVVKIDHFSPEQKIWLRDEGRLGGNAWLFIQIEDEYLLFDWDVAWDVGTLTRAQMYERATKVWRKPCNWVEWLKTIVAIK